MTHTTTSASDQALREALADGLRELVAYCREREVYKGRDNEIGADTAYGDVADQLEELLAAHPAEPAPAECPTCSGPSRETVGMVCQTCGTDYAAPVGVEITDEARKAAREAIEAEIRKYPLGNTRQPWDPPPIGATMDDLARAALEAAQPFMTSRPALDREAVKTALSHAAARVHRVGGALFIEGTENDFADAVMELAVPVPTREQIDAALRKHTVGAFQPGHSACSCDRTWRTHAEYRDHLRDAVLALFERGNDW